MVVVLSGCPAAGKSTFSSWLAKEHGFLHIDVDCGVGGKVDNVTMAEWSHFLSQHTVGSAQAFISALTRFHDPVVWDWGFPPHLFACLDAMKQAGATLWWFDAPENVAREKFQSRRRGSVRGFDAQALEIQRYWSKIRTVFQPNILKTLGEDGTYLSCEEIGKRMGLIAR